MGGTCFKSGAVGEDAIPHNSFKIVFLGTADAGKTTLYNKMTEMAAKKPFTHNQTAMYEPTLEIRPKTIDIDGHSFTFIDTGGTRSCRADWKTLEPLADFIIYVVNIAEFDQQLEEDSSRNRLEESLALFQLIMNKSGFKRKPCAIVFNKIDLFDLKEADVKEYFLKMFSDIKIRKNFDAKNFLMKRFVRSECSGRATFYPCLITGTSTQRSAFQNIFTVINLHSPVPLEFGDEMVDDENDVGLDAEYLGPIVADMPDAMNLEKIEQKAQIPIYVKSIEDEPELKNAPPVSSNLFSEPPNENYPPEGAQPQNEGLPNSSASRIATFREAIKYTRDDAREIFETFLTPPLARHLELCVFTESETDFSGFLSFMSEYGTLYQGFQNSVELTYMDQVNRLKSALQNDPSLVDKVNEKLVTPQNLCAMLLSDSAIRTEAFRQVIRSARDKAKEIFETFLAPPIARHLELCVFTDLEQDPSEFLARVGPSRVGAPNDRGIDNSVKLGYMEQVEKLKSALESDPGLREKVNQKRISPKKLCEMVFSKIEIGSDIRVVFDRRPFGIGFRGYEGLDGALEVTSVKDQSVGQREGIEPGFYLIKINGRPATLDVLQDAGVPADMVFTKEMDFQGDEGESSVSRTITASVSKPRHDRNPSQNSDQMFGELKEEKANDLESESSPGAHIEIHVEPPKQESEPREDEPHEEPQGGESQGGQPEGDKPQGNEPQVGGPKREENDKKDINEDAIFSEFPAFPDFNDERKSISRSESQSKSQSKSLSRKSAKFPKTIRELFVQLRIEEHYAKAFEDEDLHLSGLPLLSDDNIKELLPKMGPRNTLKAYIEVLKNQPELSKQQESLYAVAFMHARHQSVKSQKQLKTVKKQIEKMKSMIPDQIPDEFMCPITLKLMEDPVILADGHTCERSVIEEWFQKANTSPLTNEELENTNLIPNISLKIQIVEFKEKYPDLVAQENEGMI